MDTISTQTCIKRSKDLLYRAIDDETVITTPNFTSEKCNSFILNQVGTLIWEMADGQHSIAEMISAICVKYNVIPEVALQDTLELVNKLVERELVVVGEERVN